MPAPERVREAVEKVHTEAFIEERRRRRSSATRGAPIVGTIPSGVALRAPLRHGQAVTTNAYYDRYWTADGFNPTRRGHFPELAAVLERHARPEDAWLDVGCGDGGTSGIWLQERGIRYQGVDISQTAVARAQASGLEASVISDASELPFPDDSFAGVLAVEVLEHPVRAAEGRGGVLSRPTARRDSVRVASECRVLAPPAGDSSARPLRSSRGRRLDPGAVGRSAHSVFHAEDTEPHAHPSRLRGADVHGYAGAVLADTPKIGQRLNGRSSPLYKRAEARMPNLLGRRIYAVAIKPS